MLKQISVTAGWDSGFFVFFFGDNLSDMPDLACAAGEIVSVMLMLLLLLCTKAIRRTGWIICGFINLFVGGGGRGKCWDVLIRW